MKGITRIRENLIIATPFTKIAFSISELSHHSFRTFFPSSFDVP